MASHDPTIKDGWVNRFSNESGASTNSLPAWRLGRATLKQGNLILSRPPHELGIRSFDLSMPNVMSAASTESGSQFDSTRIRRSGSSSNTSDLVISAPQQASNSQILASSAGQSTGSRPGHLSYRGYDVHPDLIFDEQGGIIGGSLEALSHTIIFGTDDTFVPLAILCIAVIDDLVCGLELMKQYVDMIRINAGGHVDDRTLEVSADKNKSTDEKNQKNYTSHSSSTNFTVNFSRSSHAGQAEAVVRRVKVIVKTVIESYRGMVLNSNIHAGLQQLSDAISCYDDHTSTELKLQLYQKQQAMTNLLSYDNSEESLDTQTQWGPTSSATSKDPADNISDTLKSLFARVDAALAASSTAQLSVPSPSIGTSGSTSSKSLNISSNTARISSITPEIFVELTSTNLFATQIAAFHLRFYQKWSPESDASLLFPLKLGYTAFNPLVFDAKRPHFLGNLLIDHILGEKFGKLDAAQRGKLLTHWINLGSALRSLGDLVGWIAIVSVICSQPILRLRDSWAYVQTELREMVGKEWGHELFELDRRARMDLMTKRTFRVSTEEIGVTYPKERSVSYFGDLIIPTMDGSDFHEVEERINRVKVVINSWKYFFDRIPQIDSFPPAPRTLAPVQKLLSNLLVMHADSTNYTDEKLIQLSLSLEPSAAGSYAELPLISTLSIATGTYLPMVFPSTGASLRLFSEGNTLHTALGPLSSTQGGKRSNRSVSRTESPSMSSSGFPASSPTLRFSPSLSNLQRSNSIPPSSGNPANIGRPSTPSGIPQNPSSVGFGRISAAQGPASILATDLPELESSSRDFLTKFKSNHTLMLLFQDLFNIDARLYRIGQDIVLKALPSATQNNNDPHVSVATSDNIVDVVVKSATVERMIDILVLGVHGFSRLVAEEDVDIPKPNFRIDMNMHTLTFFATFRSFCTPVELLAALRRRFLGVKAAAISLVEDTLHSNTDFPNWRATGEIDLEDNRTWSLVAQIQIGIIEACHLWVSHYFNDFADDRNLWRQFLDLTELISSEIATCKGAKKKSEINPEYKLYLDTMEVLYKKVRNLFYKKTYRPNHVRPLAKLGPVGSRIENLYVGGKDSTMKLEKLIDDINTYAYGLFSSISVRDWMEVFEIFEIQAANSAGFLQFLGSSSTNEEDLVIDDIYNYLETAYVNKTDSKLLSKLPVALQQLFALHRNIMSFVTYQVADPFISRDSRIARMISVMKMLGIAKARMSLLNIVPREDDLAVPGNTSVPFFANGMSPHVPSFVEQCIMSAIVRPESRMFSYTWIEAGRELARIYRGVSSADNSWDVFIPAIDPAMLRHGRSLRPAVPCPGWIIERMVELCGCVPNTCSSQNKHINFDKRRFIYCFLTQVADLSLYDPFTEGKDTDGSLTAAIAKKLSYILNPDLTLYYLDRKTLKDAVNRELKDLPRGSSKVRVFTKYTASQVEKVKRDNKQLEIYERHAREVKRNAAKSRSGSSLGIYGQGSANSAPGSPLSGSNYHNSIGGSSKQRSRFGGLLRAVRPISMAFTGQFTPTNDRTVAVSELPELAGYAAGRFKQIQNLNLTHARIFEGVPGGINRGELHVFKIVTEDGLEYILQATSAADAQEWVTCLSKAIEEANEKYTRSLPKSTKVFGVSIEELCKREGTQIPHIVTTLLEEIEKRGLDEVGLYRVSGSLASVNALKQSFDSGVAVDMEDERWYDINTLAGCFKLYLRELSEPLLTDNYFGEFVKCGNEVQPDADDSQLEMLKACIDKLPTANYHLLKRLMNHLALVAENECNNKMKTPNLAIVFSMSFLPAGAVDHMRPIQNVVNTMIVNHEKLFDDSHTRITTASVSSPVMSGSESQADSLASISSAATSDTKLQPESPIPYTEKEGESETSDSSCQKTRASTASESTFRPHSDSEVTGDDRSEPMGTSTNRDSITEVSAY